VQLISIAAYKSGNLSKLVDAQILRGDTFARLGVDYLELDVVGFGNCANGNRASVTLQRGAC